MAFIDTFVCTNCKQQRSEIVPGDRRVCYQCRVSIARIDKEAHMKKLASLPLEVRIANIEEALYDLRLNERLSKLETFLIRY